jgi:hypothetical protein
MRKKGDIIGFNMGSSGGYNLHIKKGETQYTGITNQHAKLREILEIFKKWVENF